MTEEKMNKSSIQQLGLKAIQEYFKISPTELSKLDKETLKHIHQKAKIGLQFDKEMNSSIKSIELNYLRVFRMISDDKKEIRRLVKKTMPKYLS